MTDSPNDHVNSPKPEATDGSALNETAATPEGSDTAAATSAVPTDSRPSAADSATPTAEPPAQAPQQPASWAAPVAATQQPTAQQPTAQQPTDGQPANGQPANAQPASQQQPTAEQPTAPQPTAQAQQPAAPFYGNGAFGQSAYAQQQYAGQQHNPYASQDHYATQPLPGSAANTSTTTEKQPKRKGAGMLVAALAIGALIGGASGAGVMGIVQATQSGSVAPASSTGAQNITVNNASDATPVTAVAAKASPSVVTISVTGSQGAGTGSGVVLSEDGYVLTNTHVVTLDGEIANPTIQVQANDGKLYTAKVIGTDPIVDLAVIKLENASGMTPATFADSSKLNVGDRAVAIGAPLGLAGTVTDGIVSALNRSIQIASSAAPKSDEQQGDNGSPFDLWNFDLPGQGDSGQSQQRNSDTGTISLPVIQTDAAINPGNSGGALLNSKGEVIGINVAIASAGSNSSSGAQAGSIGVGFAVPSDLASRVAEELTKDGKASHGLLGATVKDASSSASSTTVGATIDAVTRGGAAQKAGLEAGDIVTNFNGIPVTNPTDLTAQVRFLAAGSDAKLTYVRDGKPFTVDVKLGELTQ
jgi:putative serine protease PepD